jgi:hypothetical protein
VAEKMISGLSRKHMRFSLIRIVDPGMMNHVVFCIRIPVGYSKLRHRDGGGEQNGILHINLRLFSVRKKPDGVSSSVYRSVSARIVPIVGDLVSFSRDSVNTVAVAGYVIGVRM